MLKRSVLFRFLLLLSVFIQHSIILCAQDTSLSDELIWPEMKGSVYSLLSEVSGMTDLLFVYDSSVIDNDKKLKIPAGKRTVHEMISVILENDELQINRIGSHLLIKKESVLLKPSVLLSEEVAEPTGLWITGIIKDRQTGLPLSGASVSIPDLSLGSVSNREGEYRIHLHDSLKNAVLRFSHLGYDIFEADVLSQNNKYSEIALTPLVIPLQEVVIRNVDARKLLRQMLETRDKNYSIKPSLMTAFYRECIEFKNKFQQLSEAAFDIYKTPFTMDIPDQVRLVKMSKINNLSSGDSLLVKISAGISSCMQLDIIKFVPEFLNPDIIDSPYNYYSSGIDYMDGACVNVVEFRQRKGIKAPLFQGKLYFNSDNSALIKAEIELNSKYISKTGSQFIVKHARNFKLTPERIAYQLDYKMYNGKYYLSYIRGDLFFKVRNKKLFSSSSSLYTWFEMLICDINTRDVKTFARNERLNTKSVFSDYNSPSESDFWSDYNIIPLESELNKIIEQITLQIEKTIVE